MLRIPRELAKKLFDMAFDRRESPEQLLALALRLGLRMLEGQFPAEAVEQEQQQQPEQRQGEEVQR